MVLIVQHQTLLLEVAQLDLHFHRLVTTQAVMGRLLRRSCSAHIRSFKPIVVLELDAHSFSNIFKGILVGCRIRHSSIETLEVVADVRLVGW